MYNFRKNGEEFIKDVKKLRTSQNPEKFNRGIELLIEKWRPKDRYLFQYFIKNWIKTNHTWFFGAALGYVTNNNPLEATNNSMKSLKLFKNKLTFNEYLEVKHLVLLLVIPNKLLPDISFLYIY